MLFFESVHIIADRKEKATNIFFLFFEKVIFLSGKRDFIR